MMSAGAFTANGRRTALLCLFAAALAPLSSPVLAGEPMTGSSLGIRRNAQASGGLLASAGFKLSAAVGETVASTFTSASFGFDAGLPPIFAQPGTVTSIVAVTKSTDTLELAWTAPGLDGFEGAVVDGAYRIDYSSETSHVFSPDTYVTEFTTSVQPNDPQWHTLTGLQPNTTYFARVYLVDASTRVAETSVPSEESILAHPPASPVLSGVFGTSVTFTWTVPAWGTEGYRIDGSSTDFGAALPGGVVESSMTRDGLAVTLAVTGLNPITTYYFRLGSLNWQDDYNFSTVIATVTLAGPPVSIEDLAMTADAEDRTLRFTWTTPEYQDPAGVMVLVSTNPISATVSQRTGYPLDYEFPDGTVVRSSSAADDYLHAELDLHATYYYRFYSKNTSYDYAAFVATHAFLNLPPMAPAGMHASMDPDRTVITINWSGVETNSDGSDFRVAGSPAELELHHYDVYRATGIVRSSWVWVASAPYSAAACTADIPNPDDMFYFKVESKDALADTDRAMAVDTDLNLYALGPDDVTRLKIPASMTGSLRPGGNKWGEPLVVRAVESVSDVGGRVVKSVRFDALRPGGGPAEGFRFPSPDLDVALRYEVQGGQVVSSAYAPPGAGARTLAKVEPAVGAADASRWLSAYWFNGREYVKLYGDVDSLDQTVRVRAAMPGRFQIRTVFRPAQFTFDIKEISNKVITPNGDGRNDYTVLQFYNPKDSAVSGKIYDLRGMHVADMRPGTQVTDSLTWDGTSNGRVVPRGVYIYQIKAEEKVFNGTIVVIR